MTAAFALLVLQVFTLAGIVGLFFSRDREAVSAGPAIDWAPKVEAQKPKKAAKKTAKKPCKKGR
jgi:hypothetical protein